MQTHPTSNQKTQEEAAFLEASKLKYFQLGIDFKTQGNVSMALAILAALHREIEASFDAVDKKATLPQKNSLQLERYIKCAERNHILLLKVLRVKEEVINRMYMNRIANKANEVRIDNMLTEIRKIKLETKDKVRELQIRRFSMAAMQRPFEDSLQLENEDLHMLRNGLEVLQKETYDLWNEFSSFSLPSKKFDCD